MRYAQMRTLDVSNGVGVGIALFVQGCPFHCPGCFNQETWDFNGGMEWTQELRDEFISLADRPYIRRISFLGGEPMADENYEEVISIMKELKQRHPDKQIWLYTGFDWDLLCSVRPEIKTVVDVVVAGPYIERLKDVGNRITHWAGSTNQKVIYVWSENH